MLVCFQKYLTFWLLEHFHYNLTQTLPSYLSSFLNNNEFLWVLVSLLWKGKIQWFTKIQLVLALLSQTFLISKHAIQKELKYQCSYFHYLSLSAHLKLWFDYWEIIACDTQLTEQSPLSAVSCVYRTLL